MLGLFISITSLIETVAQGNGRYNASFTNSTETPGPTTASPTLGTIIGSAIGGSIVIVSVCGLIIRCIIVSAQLNSSKKTKTKSWKNLKHIDKFETIAIKNPLTRRVEQFERTKVPIEITPV